MTLGIEALQAAATTFGRRLEAPQLSWWKNNDLALLEGTVDGVSVLVQQGYAQCLRVYFHAMLEPQLDLGLKLSLRQSYLLSAAPLSEQDLPGSARFNNAFALSAAEPTRLPSVFNPTLHAGLVNWHNAREWERMSKNSFEFWISDESVIARIEPAFQWGSWEAPNRSPRENEVP